MQKNVSVRRKLLAAHCERYNEGHVIITDEADDIIFEFDLDAGTFDIGNVVEQGADVYLDAEEVPVEGEAQKRPDGTMTGAIVEQGGTYFGGPGVLGLTVGTPGSGAEIIIDNDDFDASDPVDLVSIRVYEAA